MSNLNISLPEPIKDFIEEQAAKGGYSSVDEYLLALILQEQKRQSQATLEELLLEGLDSGETIEVTDEWWKQKRQELIFNSQTQQQLNDEEFDMIINQLDNEFAVSFGSNLPSLSDYAVSREGIYEEHP